MKIRTVLAGGGLAAAALPGGGLGAPFISAAGGGAPRSAPTATSPPRQAYPAHGTPEHEGLEKPVTGDAATKAKAAAVKSLGGGTAGAVTTDGRGDGYEVTVTKADGSQVEVHLDSS